MWLIKEEPVKCQYIRQSRTNGHYFEINMESGLWDTWKAIEAIKMVTQTNICMHANIYVYIYVPT